MTQLLRISIVTVIFAAMNGSIASNEPLTIVGRWDDKIKDQCPELFIAWRDCGLLDEKGEARPAFSVWKDFFDLPLQK